MSVFNISVTLYLIKNRFYNLIFIICLRANINYNLSKYLSTVFMYNTVVYQLFLKLLYNVM